MLLQCVVFGNIIVPLFVPIVLLTIYTDFFSRPYLVACLCYSVASVVVVYRLYGMYCG